MAKTDTYTSDYVASILDYTAETGDFFWRERPLRHFKTKRACSVWNKKHSGKKAGCIQKTGYFALTIDSAKILAHRAVFLLENGEWPTCQVDHINGDRSDNRRNNLRLATPNQNQHNRGACFGNKVGLKGVCKHTQCNRYQARIWVDGKCINLGLFKNPEDAYAAYCEAAKKYHQEFACLG